MNEPPDGTEEDWSMPDGSASMPGAFAPPEIPRGAEVIDINRRRRSRAVEENAPQDLPAGDMAPVPLRRPEPSPYLPQSYPLLSAPQSFSAAPSQSAMPMGQQLAIPLSALPSAFQRAHQQAPMGHRPMATRPRGMGMVDTVAAATLSAETLAAETLAASERGHMLGFSTLAAGTGALIGLRFGGIYGFVSGSLFAGAAVNGLRAVLQGLQKTPAGKREAIVSGTYALAAAGFGGYLIYLMKKESAMKKATPNRSDDDSCASPNGRRSCGIRPIV